MSLPCGVYCFGSTTRLYPSAGWHSGIQHALNSPAQPFSRQFIALQQFTGRTVLDLTRVLSQGGLNDSSNLGFDSSNCVVRASPDPAPGRTVGLLMVRGDNPVANVLGGRGDLRSWTCGVGRPTHNSEIPERYPMRCPRCGHGTMASAGRYDRRHTLEFMREREAFWSRVYTVASTFEDLPFEYPHELPRPET